MNSETQQQARIDFRPAVGGRGISMFTLLPLVFAFAFIWPFGGGAKKVPMSASTGTPAAQATVTTRIGDNGNTKFDIKVQDLAKPSNLTPPENVYVVWVQPPQQAAMNQGQIRVDNSLNGQFTSQAPYKRFKVFITAEKDAQVQKPQGAQVLSANVVRG